MTATALAFWTVATPSQGAVCSGTKNATTLQGCIDTAYASSTDKEVVVEGEWTIASQVTVKPHVTLRGHPRAKMKVEYGFGESYEDPSEAAFTATHHSTISNLLFYYPDGQGDDQDRSGDFEDFSPTIAVAPAGYGDPVDIVLERLIFINAIAPINATDNPDRIQIKDIKIDNALLGIWLADSWDQARIQGVHINAGVRKYLDSESYDSSRIQEVWNYAEGIRLQAGAWISDVFGHNLQIGIHLKYLYVDSTWKGPGIWTQIENSGFDFTRYGVKTETPPQGTSEGNWVRGVKILGMTFQGSKAAGIGTADTYGVYVDSAHRLIVQGCTFESQTASAIYLTSVMRFEISNNTINGFGSDVYESPAVQLDDCIVGGLTNTTVQGPADANDFGVYVSGTSSYLVLSNNLISLASSSIDRIRLGSNSSYCVVAHNAGQITNNGSDQIIVNNL